MEACEDLFFLSKCICKLSSHLQSINHKHFSYVGFSSSSSLLNSSPWHSFPLTTLEGPFHPWWWSSSCRVQGTLWVPGAAHLLKVDAPPTREAEICCQASVPALERSGAEGLTWPVSIILQEVKKLHVIIISHSLSVPLSLLLDKASSSACFPDADCCSYVFIYLFLPELCHTWKAKLAGDCRAWFAKTQFSLTFTKNLFYYWSSTVFELLGQETVEFTDF